MKNILALLLFCAFGLSQAHAQDTLSLKQQIDNYFESGRIGQQPMIILDGQVVEGELPDMSAHPPYQITILHKDEPRVIQKYGPAAAQGVVMIQSGKDEGDRQPSEGMLCLLNGKPVAMEVLQNLNPDMIQSLEVVKDPEAIAEYTDVPYEGIIIVTLKE